MHREALSWLSLAFRLDQIRSQGGTRVKYETTNGQQPCCRLDLHTATFYLANYGFIPQIISENRDFVEMDKDSKRSTECRLIGKRGAHAIFVVACLANNWGPVSPRKTTKRPKLG